MNRYPSLLRFLFRFVVSSLLIVDALSASAQTIHLPPVTRIRLANGIRLVIMEYHRAPSLSVRVSFDGGERLDPVDKVGVTDLMTTLLKRGAGAKSATEIAEAVDFLGGSLETGADEDRCRATLDVLAKDTDAGLDLLTEILRRPTFPQEELDRERSLELSSLESIGEDPARVASYVLKRVAYGDHPYGREATLSSIKAITRDDVRSAYANAISPGRMIVVAVGDFRTREFAEKLRTRFEDWQPGAIAAQPAASVRAVPVSHVLINKPDATQTQMRMVRLGFRRAASDYYAAELANAILGGGFTSRLVDEVRVNRSLTYGIGSDFASLRAGGTFGVSSFTKIETTRALLDDVQKVLAATARGGVTETEFRKANGYLAGQFAVRIETPEALAAELATIAFYGLPDDTLTNYLTRLHAVTLADVNRIARTYFDPAGMSVVLVGPAAKIASQIKGAGYDVHPVSDVGK